jgi:hypothetical protein
VSAPSKRRGELSRHDLESGRNSQVVIPHVEIGGRAAEKYDMEHMAVELGGIVTGDTGDTGRDEGTERRK